MDSVLIVELALYVAFLKAVSLRKKCVIFRF